MSKRSDGILFDDPETVNRSGYKVMVEITVEAEDHCEAEEKINDFMRDAILALADEDRDMRYTYDITDVTVAEIDFS